MESNSVSEHARAGGMGNHLIPFSGSEASDWPEGISNFTFWCPIPHNIGFDTWTMSLACSEAELLPKLEFHFSKSFFTSYSLSTQFLTFRSIWGFWKWSQMMPYSPKYWVCHHVSSMPRSWVTPEVRISLLEVLLDLLQYLHQVLGLKVDLRYLKMALNDSP